MNKQSLEYYVSNAWDTVKNVAKEVTKKPVKKAFAILFAMGVYDSFDNNNLQAQVTSPIDSVTVSYGSSSLNLGPYGLRISVWEKDSQGNHVLKDTLNFGSLELGDHVPDLTYTKNGFGVDFTDSEWVTLPAKGVVVKDGVPQEGVGTNLFNAYSSISSWHDGEFLGGNYQNNGNGMVTNAKGEFSETLHIKVRKEFVAPDSAITVISPNGGEVFEPGSNYLIEWNHNFNSGLFRLYFSEDDGKKWDYIASTNGIENGTGDLRSYTWNVPDNINSNNCLIKVEDYKSSHIGDASDNNFTIGELIDSLITITKPNGGEQFTGGQTQEILVENNYDGNNFELSASYDNGKTWEFIGNANTPKSTNSETMKYDWEIPHGVASDSCYIKAVDVNNSNMTDVTDDIFSIDINTGIESTLTDDAIPDKFSVSQNYPNPFNPSTTIKYTLDASVNDVSLKIFNQLGQLIEEHKRGQTAPGTYKIEFETEDDLSSGVYFYRIQADKNIAIKKMLYQK